MEHIDSYITALDAKEQLYRLTVENMYLREQLRMLQDQLINVCVELSAANLK